MKEDETIDIFTTKLRTLVNKAASLGHTMEDETLVRKLLNAVPDRYLQIVASIEQYSDLDEMTLEEVVGRLKTYEERIKYMKGKQDLDPTYNVVQFKIYETKPLNPNGDLVKFELDLTAKKLPPELSPRICVLMSLRFYLSGFISKDPFILDGPMSGEMPRDAVNRIYVKVYKMDMH
nr:zinc finger, CCHC-type [Tanacetum cinerariifolium]